MSFNDRLFEKLDQLDARLDSIDKTVAVQTQQLAEHMRRTELLEGTVVRLASESDTVKATVVKYNTWVNVITKVIAILAGAASLIFSVIKIF